tara:strand:- start:1944 stop:2615 length:672 start_codon:yes stop_codon:yes gene_type:complete
LRQLFNKQDILYPMNRRRVMKKSRKSQSLLSLSRIPLRTAFVGVCLSGLVGCVGGNMGVSSDRGPTAGVQAVSPSDRTAVAPEGELPPNVLTIPDLPVPPGSQVVLTDTVIVGDDLSWTGQVVLVGDASQPVQIVEFMRQNMPQYGWVETAIVRSRRTSITYVKGDRFATVRILPLTNGVEVDVVVAPAGRTAERTTTGSQGFISQPQSPQQRTTPGPVILTQ